MIIKAILKFNGEDVELEANIPFESELKEPRGHHPHDCQADCSYCNALEEYDVALSEEMEKVVTEFNEENNLDIEWETEL